MEKEINALKKAFEMLCFEEFLKSKFKEIESEIEKHKEVISMCDVGIVASFNVIGTNKVTIIAGSSKGIEHSLNSLVKNYKEHVK